WLAARLPLHPTLVSGSALDVGLNGIEFLDPSQCLLGDRRLRGFEHLEQLASGVRHASNVGDPPRVFAVGSIQRLVAGEGVGVQVAVEPIQMAAGTLTLPI